MKYAFIGALMLASAAALPAPAAAQQASITQTIAGTRLDINATGEVSRVPDVAIISAGVVSRSATASGAMQDAAARMERVIAALKRAGIADRDIQTSSVNLNPEYKYVENQPPQLVGYNASNSVTIRFRDIRNSGKILDALVGQGANQINGPNLTVDKPEAALDEARAKAVANARARADLYARALGLKVVRVVSISESGGNYPVPPPMPMYARAEAASAKTPIEPGEQKLQINLSVTFELR
ncbi:MAG TPA: SIMPL domain-containing protein [Sphingomicrobium sp.]|nr:SIMPL domain-containing protein [Sphingomicrobium sp.]